MTAEPLLVAVEGPCCAGKTTLVSALSRELSGLRVCRVPCYADYLGGGRFLPREIPQSAAEDAAAFTQLLTIDHDRIEATLTRTSDAELVLLDRSVHTLLAHRYAIEQVTGLPCYQQAVDAAHRDATIIWPSVVVYLDVAEAVVAQRNRGKFPPGSILIDPDFNGAFRSYFADLARHVTPTPTLWLDGAQEVSTLMTTTGAHITRRLRERAT